MPTSEPLKEPIFFHRGIDPSTLYSLQQPGFLKTADNVSFLIEGQASLRPFFSAVNSSVVGSVHSMKAWKDKLFIGDTTHLRGNSGSGDFTDLYAAFTNAMWQFKPYKDFLVGSNGTNFVLADDDLNVYPAQVTAPLTTPAGVAGVAGNPNGVYRLYVSYYVTWPNGHTYETGLSPVGSDVTVSSQKIEWSNIPLCPYAGYYGSAPTIYRNLYRGPGTAGALTEIYYVGTISDNTTQTYSDDVSDADLEAGFVCSCEDYLPIIVPKFFVWNYGRMFGIHPTYFWRLYYTETVLGSTSLENEQLFPLAMLEDNWDDIRVPGFDYVDPQGLFRYGSYVYIPLKDTWIRKQGNEPETWAFRPTYATMGLGAPATAAMFPQGIIGLTSPENSEPTLAIFDGSNSKVLSPRVTQLLRTDLNMDQISLCRGGRIGSSYVLTYPSGSATYPDKVMVVDLSSNKDPKISMWTDLSAVCVDSDKQSSSVFIGGSDGVVRKRDTSGTVDVEIETHELFGIKPELSHTEKQWTRLSYALNSNDVDVTLKAYIDDVLQTWPDNTTELTIKGTGELSQNIPSLPSSWHGKKIRLEITGTGLSELEIYSPWVLEFSV